MKDKEINELIEEENKHLLKFKEIVARTMEDEKLILKSLIQPSIESISSGQRIGHKVARFCRSWAFILFFCPPFLCGFRLIHSQ